MSFIPTFISKLFSPEIDTVLLLGCGGGFDFVHGMALYPELIFKGKKVIIGSYSFGLSENMDPEAPVVFKEDKVLVRKVNGNHKADEYYAPEVLLCRFLDIEYSAELHHEVYAYYARDFSVPILNRFYQELCNKHEVDAVVLIDGGSDSLIIGDEAGVGDPVEDAVSVAAVNKLEGVKEKVLIAVGLGSNRFNDVSDASSLRAIAELSKIDGFLGSISLEKESEPMLFYRRCIEYIFSNQKFTSIIAANIISSADGHFGNDTVPPLLSKRLRETDAFYFWPLMSMLWGFDVGVLYNRSLICKWIEKCATPKAAWEAVTRGRRSMGEKILPIENLPRHEQMRSSEFYNFTSGCVEGDFIEELENVE